MSFVFLIFCLFIGFGLKDLTLVEGKFVNVTIDDTLGDARTGLKVQYSSSSEHPNANGTVWTHQTCDDCHQVKTTCQDGSICTWSSATPLNGTEATATFQFNGSAIYIYFILVNSTSSGNSSNATGTDFLLDGKHVGHYEQSGKHSDSLVYSNSSISSGNHQFSIRLSYPSYAVFDYAMYTTEMADDIDTTSQSNSTNSTGPNNGQDSPSVTSVLSSSSSSQKRSKLVAIIIGIVAPLFLIFAGILFLRRRYRSQFSAALARVVPRFGWIRSKASQVFHERREGQARERIWSHDFKLTPLPRRNKRRNSNASRMRSYTPGLDMHCRGDDYPEELGTPRGRFDFIFSLGGDRTPRRKSRFDTTGFDEAAVANSEATSGGDQASISGFNRTLSRSSLKKMYDLHSRPLPPIPASPPMPSPEHLPAVRLLPSPGVPGIMNGVSPIPGTPPPGYYS
ncbi:hypothetical protein VKT23_017641 [Stygiomarasmius scandens]|uniref:Uncharacterized protein n=1 Tax=Marasmiellus scandens TaxID=2682957 RepID=A0ABR1IUT6_9AGAR